MVTLTITDILMITDTLTIMVTLMIMDILTIMDTDILMADHLMDTLMIYLEPTRVVTWPSCKVLSFIY